MTIFLTSLKRILNTHRRYAVTVKDTEGFMWTLILRKSSLWNIAPFPLYRETKPLGLNSYLVDKKTCKEIVKQLKAVDDDFWASPLEDYPDGATPNVLIKNSIEIISIGLHYGTSKPKDW